MTRGRVLVPVIVAVVCASTALPASAAILEVCKSGCNYRGIQVAINAASPGDTVLVHDGFYAERINFMGKAVAVRSVNGPATTVIDGSRKGSVVTFSGGEGAGSVLDGFTITNGSATNGGGVYCDTSSPTISNCTVRDNVAGDQGGGIYCGNSSPTISNCIVSGNSAGDQGGGIYCSNSHSTISNCIVSGNSATGGGGIYGVYSALVISHCTLSGNSATIGGGIECYWSTPTISNCTISSNSAGMLGGGICGTDSTLTIFNSTISSNSAGSAGGGISCESASPIISSCTISGNSAGSAGGGIRIANANGVMVNSILWGDTAPSEPEVVLFSGGLTATYSDVQGGPMPGEGNIDSDPLFVSPGDFRLAAGSPCIDAGTTYTGMPAYDLTGDPRPQGAGCDIGSDEFALVANGSFEEVAERIPVPWTGKRVSPGDGRVTNAAHGGRASFRMSGSTAATQLVQTFTHSGSAGDVLDVACWHKAYRPSTAGGFFGASLTVIHADGTRKVFRLAFPRNTHDWRKSSGTFTTLKDYLGVSVSLVYANQRGQAWFDDVQLSVRR